MNSLATAADTFWQFSLEVYSRPQVADLCLALQDDHGFDVNVLLLCLWLAREKGRTLGPTEIQALCAGVTELNQNLVWPLRRARRWTKTKIDVASDPQAQAECRKVYADLKTVELRGERCVQAALLECLAWGGAGEPRPTEVAARASLENYRQVITAPDLAAVVLMQLIVRAVA